MMAKKEKSGKDAEQDKETRELDQQVEALTGSNEEMGSEIEAATTSQLMLGESIGQVATLVERFDRRGTGPFELFRSAFGQN